MVQVGILNLMSLYGCIMFVGARQSTSRQAQEVTTSNAILIMTISDIQIIPKTSSFEVRWDVIPKIQSSIIFEYKQITSSNYTIVSGSYSSGNIRIDELEELSYYIVCVNPPIQKILDVDCVIERTLEQDTVNTTLILSIVLPPLMFLLGVLAGLLSGHFYRRHRNSRKLVPPSRQVSTFVEDRQLQQENQVNPYYIAVEDIHSKTSKQSDIALMPVSIKRRNSAPPGLLPNRSLRAEKVASDYYIEVIENVFDKHFYDYIQLRNNEKSEKPIGNDPTPLLDIPSKLHDLSTSAASSQVIVPTNL